MIYIAIGRLGFLVMRLLDIVSLKRLPEAKPFIWILGSGLLGYALVMTYLRSDKLSLPVWPTWLGWILLTISLLMLTYSLFINLHFRKTYIATGIVQDKFFFGRISDGYGSYWLLTPMPVPN